MAHMNARNLIGLAVSGWVRMPLHPCGRSPTEWQNLYQHVENRAPPRQPRWRRQISRARGSALASTPVIQDSSTYAERSCRVSVTTRRTPRSLRHIQG